MLREEKVFRAGERFPTVLSGGFRIGRVAALWR
jgi:hypothetical protein